MSDHARENLGESSGEGGLFYRLLTRFIDVRPRELPTPIAVVNAALGDDAGLAGAGAWHRAFRPEAASR